MARLLFDENLSHLLVELIAPDFPASNHVRNCGLKGADDTDVWRYAAQNGFTIVSKDGDLHQMSLLYGAPPKVILVAYWNARQMRFLGDCARTERRFWNLPMMPKVRC
jgi:predicted nuclease of predicted toxin-antitoxin system